MRVVVTATNAGGSIAATSPQTAIVAGIPPSNTVSAVDLGVAAAGSDIDGVERQLDGQSDVVCVSLA